MKLENLINLAAVAVIAAHLGKKSQQKKEEHRVYVDEVTYTSCNEYPGYQKYAHRSAHTRIDGIIFGSRKDAEHTLSDMIDISVKYGSVSVSDLYDLIGLPTTFKDNKIGWPDLKDASIQRTRYGYKMVLPEPRELK